MCVCVCVYVCVTRPSLPARGCVLGTRLGKNMERTSRAQIPKAYMSTDVRIGPSPRLEAGLHHGYNSMGTGSKVTPHMHTLALYSAFSWSPQFWS